MYTHTHTHTQTQSSTWPACPQWQGQFDEASGQQQQWPCLWPPSERDGEREAETETETDIDGGRRIPPPLPHTHTESYQTSFPTVTRTVACSEWLCLWPPSERESERDRDRDGHTQRKEETHTHTHTNRALPGQFPTVMRSLMQHSASSGRGLVTSNLMSDSVQERQTGTDRQGQRQKEYADRQGQRHRERGLHKVS